MAPLLGLVAALTAPSACYEAFLPSFPTCHGYATVGYICQGQWCAVDGCVASCTACAYRAAAGFVVDPSRGRCTPLTGAPTRGPTPAPSKPLPPSASPTVPPSEQPTNVPSVMPTGHPSLSPTGSPSSAPSVSPTYRPSPTPSDPSVQPSSSPILPPTGPPSRAPVVPVTVVPTFSPRALSTPPSATPTAAPQEPTSDHQPPPPPHWRPQPAVPVPVPPPILPSPVSPPSPVPPPSPPPLQSDQGSVEEAREGIASVLAVSSLGAASGVTAIAVLAEDACEPGYAEDRDLSRVLHPLGVRLGGSAHAGAVVFNILLFCGIIMLQSAALRVGFSAAGCLGMRRAEVAALLQFPGWNLTVLIFLYQGTALGGAYLLMRPSIGWFAPVLGLLGTLVATCGVPYAIQRLLVRPAAQHAAYAHVAPLRWLEHLMLGQGEWVSRKQDFWLQRYGNLLRTYRPPHHGSALQFQLLEVAAVSCLGALPKGAMKDCFTHHLAYAGIFLVHGLWCLYARPYARPRDAWYEGATTVLLVSAEGCRAAAYKTSDPVADGRLRAASSLLLAAMIVVAIKLLLDFVSVVWLWRTKRHTELQLLVYRQPTATLRALAQSMVWPHGALEAGQLDAVLDCPAGDADELDELAQVNPGGDLCRFKLVQCGDGPSDLLLAARRPSSPPGTSADASLLLPAGPATPALHAGIPPTVQFEDAQSLRRESQGLLSIDPTAITLSEAPTGSSSNLGPSLLGPNRTPRTGQGQGQGWRLTSPLGPQESRRPSTCSLLGGSNFSVQPAPASVQPAPAQPDQLGWSDSLSPRLSRPRRQRATLVAPERSKAARSSTLVHSPAARARRLTNPVAAAGLDVHKGL
eukprot:TRINITY_DN7584_c0_g1_i3.p1 TRINITY_DN7584_c0_g1~~TRINITY_DN7584_c0_g1_i3.p1  ORF type:complete len:857 (+),score=64.84 TRINITY_DN7584_c0_g1_i3:89-2659(+)